MHVFGFELLSEREELFRACGRAGDKKSKFRQASTELQLALWVASFLLRLLAALLDHEVSGTRWVCMNQRWLISLNKESLHQVLLFSPFIEEDGLPFQPCGPYRSSFARECLLRASLSWGTCWSENTAPEDSKNWELKCVSLVLRCTYSITSELVVSVD